MVIYISPEFSNDATNYILIMNKNGVELNSICFTKKDEETIKVFFYNLESF